MAVLKSNVLIRDGGGEIVRLPQGMSRDALEALADEYGDRAQEILDNPAHWVDALPEVDGPERRNLLADESSSIVKPLGTAARRRGQSDDDEDAPKRRGRKPAPKGVVEA